MNLPRPILRRIRRKLRRLPIAFCPLCLPHSKFNVGRSAFDVPPPPTMHPCFPDRLQVTAMDFAGGKRMWRLDARFRAITSLGVIDVPKNFVTDLASVPRFLWAAFSPADEYLEAAIIHDWLYSADNDRITRAEADRLFLELMYNLGVPWHRRHAVYTAVRLFGGRSWQANA